MTIILANNSDMEVMSELGRRLKRHRLQRNLTLSEVAARAGISKTTVVNAEAGANPSLETLVRLLRVLGRLEALDALLPAPSMSPIELVRLRGKQRKRARTPRVAGSVSSSTSLYLGRPKLMAPSTVIRGPVLLSAVMRCGDIDRREQTSTAKPADEQTRKSTKNRSNSAGTE